MTHWPKSSGCHMDLRRTKSCPGLIEGSNSRLLPWVSAERDGGDKPPLMSQLTLEVSFWALISELKLMLTAVSCPPSSGMRR